MAMRTPFVNFYMPGVADHIKSKIESYLRYLPREACPIERTHLTRHMERWERILAMAESNGPLDTEEDRRRFHALVEGELRILEDRMAAADPMLEGGLPDRGDSLLRLSFSMEGLERILGIPLGGWTRYFTIWDSE